MGTRTASRLAGLGAAIVVLALAILAAGCGSSNSSNTTNASSGGGGGSPYGGGSSSKTASSGGGGTAAVVSTSSGSGKLGTFLVDSKGNTLYYFEKDKQNSGNSTCSGSCAAVWTPYSTSRSPKASKSASASKLGTIKRSDGSMQVTYNGWPLYTYTADSAPGQTNGEDIKSFGASWYVLTPAGSKPAGA